VIPSHRIAYAFLGLVAITALGTLGYVLVEGASFTEALFMTVITVSTVGYREVAPLSPAGAGDDFVIDLERILQT
jgi:voltage-gated potassium channel